MLSRIAGQVVSLDRGYPLIKTLVGELRAQHSIDLIKNSETRVAIGDNVSVECEQDQDCAQIVAIHPRSHTLYRRSMVQSRSLGAGKYNEQILAANVDFVIVVSSIAHKNFDLNYLERQLVMAHESGAMVAVALSKADLAKNVGDVWLKVEQVCPNTPVVACSTKTGQGVDELRALIEECGLAALLGRSGVGKSSLANALLGHEAAQTAQVRAKDSAGRHTTVARRMLFLDTKAVHRGNGAGTKPMPAIIDTPGLRSLGLYDAHLGLATTFADITELAAECHYRDCSHTTEPSCAVVKALQQGKLDKRRVDSYASIAKEVFGKEQHSL